VGQGVPATGVTQERQIMETTDASLVRKLHAMRAAQSVFEYEHSRWIITRIVSLENATDPDEPMWAVYGRRARR